MLTYEIGLSKGFKGVLRLLDELGLGEDLLQDFLREGSAIHPITVAGDLIFDLSHFLGTDIRRGLDRFQGFLDAFGLGGQGNLLPTGRLACRLRLLSGRFLASHICPVLNGFILIDSNIVAWDFHNFDHSAILGEYRSTPSAPAGQVYLQEIYRRIKPKLKPRGLLFIGFFPH